jgi:hypothetical protein
VDDSLGGVQTSVYDAANRLTSRQFGGTGQMPLREDFTYTARACFPAGTPLLTPEGD